MNFKRTSKNTLLIKNLILGVLALIGFIIANLVDYPKNPEHPFIFVGILLILMNLNLQYIYGLPMGITVTIAAKQEYQKRDRLLVFSWIFTIGMLLFLWFS